MPPKLKLLGKKFGRLTVIDESKKRNKVSRSVLWKCRCECGNIKDIVGVSLTNKMTLSCGCLGRERRKKATTKHGVFNETKFYYCFHGIKQRCQNEKASYYKDYGGRGIKCEWKDIIEFKNDMYESYLKHVKEHGEKETQIDRVDVNKNYCKENCRWVTIEQQMNNTRKSHLATHNGKTQTLARWARELNINYGTLCARINDHKWSIEKAFLTPVKK
jgi:hypothetical protein